MNGIFNRFKIFIFALGYLILIGASPSDYSKLETTGKQVISILESTQEELKGIIDSLVDMMNNGIETISKEYWEKEITPVLLKADGKLSPVQDMLLSTLPANFNINRIHKDPKDEPWTSIHNLSLSINYIDLKREKDIYDSEYLMLLIGASNYIQMYVSIFYGRYNMIENDKEQLKKIISNPKKFRKQMVESKQHEDMEMKLKKSREKQEKKQNALRKHPIAPNLSLDSYLSPFSFAGIPLGLEFYSCIAHFKSKGYKVNRKDIYKDSFNGFTPIAFLSGTYEGYPTTIKIQASSKSYRVYGMEILIDKVIDDETADELMNSIATNFAYSHPNYTVEANDSSQSLSMAESKNGDERLFNKMGIPSLGIILRDYSTMGDQNSYTGMISLVCVQDSPGCSIEYCLYDSIIDSIAYYETK